LSSKTSEILAEVLRDCVHTRPADLFGHVAQALQERSGLDPLEFEKHFEECRQKPRTYTLEDRVPVGQDPYNWVPMRYNDDTISLSLKRRAAELTSEILAAFAIEDMKAFLDRMVVAFPELMYIRASPSELVGNFGATGPEELAALQALRAVYLACSGCPEVPFDDESVEMDFRCEALVRQARAVFLQPAKDEAVLEALVVLMMLRALGANENFRRRCGGGVERSPEEAALHAIDNQESVLPSFHRLSSEQKTKIRASLQVFFPLGMLITTEAMPAHFSKAKDHLVPCPGAMDLFSCALVVDYMVSCRAGLMKDEAVDYVKIGLQSLASLDKYSAPRAYEMFLKKRGERHGWRVVRDDNLLKAIVRCCCLAGLEDTDAWNDMLSSVEKLPDRQREVLQTEMARKDGCAESPAYILVGGGQFMRAACSSLAVGAMPALLLLARILEDAARHFDHALLAHQHMVHIDLRSLAKRVTGYTPGGAAFEDLPFTLQESGVGFAVVRLAGDAP